MPRSSVRRIATAFTTLVLAAGMSACDSSQAPRPATPASGHAATSPTQAGSAPTVRRVAFLTGKDIVGFGESLRVGSFVFFAVAQGRRDMLWRTDGTAAGTLRLATVPGRITHLTGLGSAVLFSAGDASHGREPWVSDGAPAGTVMLRDLMPGPGGSAPSTAAELDGVGYFTARTPEPGLWRTDGTPAGTREVRRLPAAAPDIATAGGRLYLAAQLARSHVALWRCTGPACGLATVAEWDQPSLTFIHLGDLTPVGPQLFFTVSTYDMDRDTDTWALEVVSRTTAHRRLYHHTSGAADSDPPEVTPIGSQLFFQSPTGTAYRTDGSTAGTRALRGLGEMPYDFLAFQGRLYYQAGGVNTDSSVRLADLDGSHPRFIRSFDIGELVPGPGHVYFVVYDPPIGPLVWRTDGTAGGTRQVSPVPRRSDAEAALLASGPSCAFWLWWDGAGTQLWRSEG